MKDVNGDDDDDDLNDGNNSNSDSEMLSSKSSLSSLSNDKEGENKEVTGMELIWEEDYILMVCCDAKNIYVYDEDDTEESHLLRKLTGGHIEEISILKYCDWLSLMATGSVDGEIAVWDFEMSKLEGICVGHKADITGIEFVAPHPLMITSSMDCTVCIWGLRPLPIALKYICLHRFHNVSWSYNKDV